MADKENMLFFETSAKNATGVSNMMYTCIAKLPYFEQFEVERENLIQELANNNSKNTEGGIFEIKIDKTNNNPVNADNSSNIVLNKNNNIEKEKKRCGCWIIYILLIW